MMNDQIIARRYAKGLMLSLPKQDLKAIEHELKAVAELMAFESDFALLCEDPNFSLHERRGIIDRIAHKFGLNETFHKFLLVLARKARLSLLPSIYHALTSLIDEEQGRLQVTILSATPLAESQVNEISEKLMQVNNKKEVLTRTVIDESLLGGVRVEAAGTVFDATLKAKLFALKSKLLQEIGIGH